MDTTSIVITKSIATPSRERGKRQTVPMHGTIELLSPYSYQPICALVVGIDSSCLLDQEP